MFYIVIMNKYTLKNNKSNSSLEIPAIDSYNLLFIIYDDTYLFKMEVYMKKNIILLLFVSIYLPYNVYGSSSLEQKKQMDSRDITLDDVDEAIATGGQFLEGLGELIKETADDGNNEKDNTGEQIGQVIENIGKISKNGCCLLI